jgi:hypothetical protein
MVAPLWGLKVESLPIRLSSTDAVEIDQLSDTEIARCLNMGLSPRLFPRDMGLVQIDSAIGVRIRFRLPKRVGNDPPEPFNKLFERYEKLREELQSAIHTLRLFKEGNVPTPGYVMFSEQWPNEGATQSLGGVGPVSCDYELKGEESRGFEHFWNDLRKAAERKFIDGAVRRFGYAGERHRSEDRLVDLLIAAESLFLADAGGELSYRLSMRFAFFVDGSDYSRRELFEHMRKAYTLRSSIVHGGNADDRLLVLPKGDKVTLERFVDETRHLLRFSLKKGIHMAATKDSTLEEWEQSILG